MGLPLFLVVLLPIAAVDARTSVDDLLESAGKRYVEKKHEAAAEQLGRAAALAQKKNDPLAERRVAGCLQTLLLSLRDGADGTIQRRAQGMRELNAEQRRVLAAVLPALEAKRSAAFVSAPVLARLLLYAATEQGDLEHVALAAPVLVAHAEGRGSGQAAAALARYAEGMLARTKELTEAADQHLAAALDAAHAQGWVDLAAHAGTELAWLRWSDEDAAETLAVLARVAELFQGDVSAETAQAWTRAVQARMPQGATDLAKLVNDATGRLRPQAGDPENQSVSSGKAKLTPLGRAFKKMGARKPLVRVKRVEGDMHVETLFSPEEERALTPPSGDRKLDLNGLHLVLRDRHVGLEEMQTENYEDYGRGTGDDDALLASARTLTLVRADYPLARDETWSVTRGGVVRIE